MRYGKCPGHHRGHRPEHVFTGLAWELGRAICLLAQIMVRKPYPNFQAYEARKPRPLYEPLEEHKSRRVGKVPGAESEERTNLGWACGSLSRS